jgi:hypothetical protein
MSKYLSNMSSLMMNGAIGKEEKIKIGKAVQIYGGLSKINE